MNEEKTFHVPVMVAEVVQYMAQDFGDKIYVDCTFGSGGHTEALLSSNPNCKIIALDRDAESNIFATRLQAKYPGRISFFNEKFSNIDLVLKHSEIEYVDGILYDIGVSSMQLDIAERGFSFQSEAILDMRMGLCSLSAFDVVNNTSEHELANILYLYGGERKSRKIARAIVQERQRQPIKTTLQLSDVIRKSVKVYKDDIHHATRTFQALRIVVNDELSELKLSLNKTLKLLKPATDSVCMGGILSVITFHSLEDKIVKDFMLDASGKSVATFNRHDINIHLNNDVKIAQMKIATKKPIRPSIREISENNRSRSAKLRVAIRI